MKRLLLLCSFVLFVSSSLVAQTFDKFISGYNKVEGAEVLEISGKELAALRYMMPQHQKAFFKLVDKMVTIVLKGCTPVSRARFYAEISEFSPEGYLVEIHESEGVGKTRVFVKVDEKKGVCTEIVIAALSDSTDVALTVLKGKFGLDDMKVMFE